MERDLAEFRERKLAHRTSNIKFLDDALMIRLNGPRTVVEFAEGTKDLSLIHI